MKKMWMSLFLTITLLLVLTVEAQANTEWQIIWDEDSTIVETVLTDNEELSSILSSCGFKEGEVEGSYSRRVEDWGKYNNLEKKFPIVATTKNLVIFSLTTITIDNNRETNILKDFNQTVKLQFTALGFNLKNTGHKVSELTSEWELKPGWIESSKKPYLTKCVTFNGFMLGAFIFIVGLLTIAIVFLRAISRVNHLIEEEYSIENYLAQQEEINKSEE